MSSSTVFGYAAMVLDQPPKPYTYPAAVLGDREVRVEVSHCGLCYTDVQGISDRYGICDFPFVPGHEIVGYVSELGSAVTTLKIGDRVGIGWQGRSCGACEWCKQGEIQLCENIDVCGVWRPYGGFATSIKVDEQFAYSLPADMASEVGAVLMCAGIAVFNPLDRYAAGGKKKVAIMGLGGLGHLAVEIAHALGCEVTAISSSSEKREQAFRLGADDFILILDEHSMRKVRFAFDILLYTSHADINWTALMNSIRTNGKFVVVGFPEAHVKFDPLELVVHQSSITGSFTGNHDSMRRMLEFAQTHAIHPTLELLPMREVNHAIRSLKEEKPQHRYVLFN